MRCINRVVLLTVLLATPLASLLSEMALAQSGQPELVTIGTLAQLMRAGVGDDLLILVIGKAKKVEIDTSPQGIVVMKQAGFSDAVIRAIVERRTNDVLGSRSTPAMPPQQAAAPPGQLPPGLALPQQQVKFSEPDDPDAYYYLRESPAGASLEELERIRLDRRNMKVKSLPLIVVSSPTGRQVSEIDANRSPVRFRSGQSVFITNRANRVEVDGDYRRNIRLIRLDPKRNKRELVWSKSSLNVDADLAANMERERGIRLSATAVGQRSIKIMPEVPLPPGEYAFLGGDDRVGYVGEFFVYCFGIDKK